MAAKGSLNAVVYEGCGGDRWREVVSTPCHSATITNGGSAIIKTAREVSSIVSRSRIVVFFFVFLGYSPLVCFYCQPLRSLIVDSWLLQQDFETDSYDVSVFLYIFMNVNAWFLQCCCLC